MDFNGGGEEESRPQSKGGGWLASGSDGAVDDVINSGTGTLPGSPSAVDKSQLVEKRKSSSPRPASGEVDSLRAVSGRAFSL